MLLKELFLNLPEDYARHPIDDKYPTNLPTFNPSYSKVIGTQDGLDVWGSREQKGFEIFGFKEGDKVIAYIILEETKVDGSYPLRELWVDPSFRGKGRATALIIFLTRKVKIKLVLLPNEIVSDSARAILIKAISSSKVKATTNDGTDPILVLKDLNKTSTAVTIFETCDNGYPLFGKQMILPDGRKTFQEHCLVILEGIYD